MRLKDDGQHPCLLGGDGLGAREPARVRRPKERGRRGEVRRNRDGRRRRALTVVDTHTREALAINVDQGIKVELVVAAMKRIAALRKRSPYGQWRVCKA